MDKDFFSTNIPYKLLHSIQASLWRYTYRGILMQKSPFDIALYTKLVWDIQPRTIIEIGTQAGGSALWFADLLGTQGNGGHVYTIDINVDKTKELQHPHVTFLQGDIMNLAYTFSPEEIEKMPRPLLVVEDSAHDRKTSTAALEYFEPLMRPGEYIVIEDGIVDHLPAVERLFNGGPSAAIVAFLEKHGGNWMIDRQLCDFFGYNVTWNTNGFLLKLSPRAFADSSATPPSALCQLSPDCPKHN